MPLQSISDSCRYLTTMQWHKQKDDPPELADELNFKCGDAGTEKELKGSYFPNKDATQFLSALLQPLVVSSAALLPSHLVDRVPACNWSPMRPHHIPFRLQELFSHACNSM